MDESNEQQAPAEPAEGQVHHPVPGEDAPVPAEGQVAPVEPAEDASNSSSEQDSSDTDDAA